MKPPICRYPTQNAKNWKRTFLVFSNLIMCHQGFLHVFQVNVCPLSGQLVLARLCYVVCTDFSVQDTTGSVLSITAEARKDLEWWVNSIDNWNGYRIKLRVAEVQIVTDASPSGYGAVCNGLEASGFWSRCIAKKCQNYRELMAILVAINAFKDIIRDKYVHVLTDNFTAMT
jgi:hypothetical protein